MKGVLINELSIYEKGAMVKCKNVRYVRSYCKNGITYSIFIATGIEDGK